MFQMRKEREAITNLGPKARNLWLLGGRVQVPDSWDPWVISLADSGGGYACAQCMCVCVCPRPVRKTIAKPAIGF